MGRHRFRVVNVFSSTFGALFGVAFIIVIGKLHLLIISVQVLLYDLIGFLGVLSAMPLVACAVVLVKTVYVEGVLGDESQLKADAGNGCVYRETR